MGFSATAPSRGAFPRRLSNDLLWTGGCLDIAYKDYPVHTHFCAYVIKGATASVLIDTGHPFHWETMERSVEEFLEGRPLDYVFPTHVELPHCGLLPNWLEKYKNAELVGAVAEYPIYYPEYAGRMRAMAPGDALDLGDRKLVFLPAVWRDLRDTLWAFDTKARTLFVSDGFAYLHYHDHGQCDMLTSEQPIPDVKMMQFFNERALYWTRHTDPADSFEDIDALISHTQPLLIATAHGGVIDTQEAMLPVAKQSMAVRNEAPWNMEE